MTEGSRKKILYVVLVGAVIFGVYNFSRPRKHYVPGTMTQAEQTPAVSAPVPPTQPPLNIAAIEKAGWGRDPFKWSTQQQSRPQPRRRTAEISRESETVPGWKLTAIVFSTSLPLAIVNGKTVKVGDVVDRAKVLSIDQKKVMLLYNGGNIEVRMSKG